MNCWGKLILEFGRSFANGEATILERLIINREDLAVISSDFALACHQFVHRTLQLPLRLSLLVFCLLLSAQASSASLFAGASQIVVFGDSASSVTLGTKEYRFTNDLVWAEYLGNALGLQASIYAQPGGYTKDDLNGLSLFRQMDAYYADNSGLADGSAVHIMFIGGNDPTLAGITLEQSHLNRQAALQDLIAKGASNIVLINLPDPFRYSDADLQQYVPQGVTIYDLYQVLYKLADYGVTDLTTPCRNTPSTCDYSMRWDGTGHPASGFHKAIALDLQATFVPVPAAAWLFGSAILGLVGLTRSKRN